MGFIPKLLGFDGGGSNFQAQGVDPSQLAQAYGQNQNNMAMQQQFLQALQGQGGVGNQANVFAQQQQLANQLGAQAQGAGPNPALDQLANTTGQNIASQASLMAGQRGIGANPGLAVRQIGQQGAGIQQQATGQAALQRSQQQLAAQQMLQQQQAGMGNLATQQVGQQANALSGLGNMGLANQQQLLGMQANQNSANSGVAQQTAKSQGDTFGTLLGGVGKGLSYIGMADGGQVPQGPQSIIGKHFHSMKQGGSVPGKASVSGDSMKNDTVPAMLSPGEIVLPRSVAQSDDAPEKAEKFVTAILQRGRGK